MRSTFKCALFLLFLLPFGSAAWSEEVDSSDLILILDGSNSMWGQIDGTNKIVIARESLNALIDDMPDDKNVGLIAYGHRREGDCEDIETLAPVAPINKTELKKSVAEVNPKGKTPITASINTAVEMARQRERTSIILISDGLETCGLDPCGAVRTAKESGSPFVLHVIGFDVASEDTSQLECAAQSGGGLFLSAENSQQLSDALDSAYEKPTTPDGRLVVTATAEGQLQDALVQVVSSSGDHIAGGRTYASENTNPRHIPLEDGHYSGEVSAVGIKGSPSYNFDFEIADGNRVEKTFDFSAGELSVRVTRNGALSDAVLSIQSSSDGTKVAGGRTYTSATHNPKVMKLAAGTYDVGVKSVEMRNGPELLFEDVVVKGKERTELEHEFVSGDLSIGARRGDELVDAVINVIDSDGRNVGGGRTYTSGKTNPKSFVVAPGDYTIRLSEIRGDKRDLEVSVVAGGTSEVLVDLDQP